MIIIKIIQAMRQPSDRTNLRHKTPVEVHWGIILKISQQRYEN